MKHFLLRLVAVLMVLGSTLTSAQDNAKQLFGHHQPALYQIRMIELESGNKSSIGSGFQVSADGLVVTNYHVVSDAVFYPQKYRMEYQAQNGETGELNLVHVDVVNDLALVRIANPGTEFFNLALGLPSQGDNIYSLGNPHDLGMIVVPGTYNGLKKNSFNAKIHFTGSINPGMSGGPTVNKDGEVIGVNVATAGNQIGFLVPLMPLTALVERAQEPTPQDFMVDIQSQLLENQQRLLAPFTAQSWPLASLGQAKVAGEVVDFLPCWGDSNSNDQNAFFLTVQKRCRLDEEIYLHNSLRTGSMEMEYEWLSSEKLSSAAFYNLFEQSLQSVHPGNNAGKEDVTNFACEQQRIQNQQQMQVRLLFCTRSYQAFPELYDVLILGASYDRENQGLISHFTLAGVTRELSQAFSQRFLEALAWQ
ncbi:serine protease [Aliiglaciecola sp. CAU 1673]|uniref:S1 family peptidase n=1 Tax=Aliiglaciecola sp. CAU 1673 TaxID=3032595 RepID=UPI0023DBE030|nr:serine protease [Aliiglaciecola sp. CAU 1673]MDF2179993.1 serine protease [Aliiglaciecola sp. CAU 1673]